MGMDGKSLSNLGVGLYGTREERSPILNLALS